MALPALPAADAAAIHVHTSAGQIGPFSRRDLAARLAAGEIQNSDNFWFDGMGGWEAIAAHAALLEGLGGVPPAAPESGQSADDRMDAVFGKLVKDSWAYYNAHARAGHVDEVFLGAIITATLDNDYSLIDLNSDGTHHYTRFQNLKDNSRIICQLTHLTGDLTKAKVHGHRASVVIGYGERVDDFSRIFQAVKAEVKSGYIQSAEPGTITVDGDMNTGYIYVQVDLYLCIDDYVTEGYGIKTDVLKDHLGATINALQKYLRGRFKK